MATRHIGLIVTGCLIGGLVAALVLVVGPVAGAQEHVITGTALLTFSANWALLATLSMLRTEQPQRWAFALASFMALAGAALPCARRWNGRARSSASAQSHTVLGRVSAAEWVRALRR